MRVGIDCTVLHGRFSGVERAVCGLLRGLCQTDGNHSLSLIGDPASVELPLPETIAWTLIDFDPARRLRRIIFQQFELDRLARESDLDLIHGPAYVTPIRGRVPCIATVYDLMVFLHPEMCARGNRLHYRHVMPRCLPRCDKVIVPATVVADSLMDVLGLPANRIEVIGLGLDEAFDSAPSPEHTEDVRDRLGLPDRFALFVGNLEPKKGLAVLVEAMGLLAESGDAIDLVLAGKRAWGMERLGELIGEAGIASHVHFTGYVNQDDLPALYAAAHWFVFPSLYEGFGLPPLEAMASGTPVIASDGGALPETTGDACVRVPAGDPMALAAAIRDSWDDNPLRNELSAAGRKQAKRFSWRNHASAVRLVYEEVCGG